LSGYVVALGQGWSADSARGKVAADEELERIKADGPAFLASLVDREAKREPVTFPDGPKVARLPGNRRWLWDGEFCGAIGFRKRLCAMAKNFHAISGHHHSPVFLSGAKCSAVQPTAPVRIPTESRCRRAGTNAAVQVIREPFDDRSEPDENGMYEYIYTGASFSFVDGGRELLFVVYDDTQGVALLKSPMNWRPDVYVSDLFQQAEKYLRSSESITTIEVCDPTPPGRGFIPMAEAIQLACAAGLPAPAGLQ
jgi:hypothetical protein